MDNFEIPYSANALNFVRNFADAILACAKLYNHASPLGVAASIARETTAADSIYKILGSHYLWVGDEGAAPAQNHTRRGAIVDSVMNGAIY